MTTLVFPGQGSQYLGMAKDFYDNFDKYSENILSRALGLSKGGNYSEEDFTRAVYDRMQGLYMDKGYIYSRIEPEITPVDNDSLDIHFIISENHKVFIRNILIKGNERTRENVIRRIMRIYPGDVFNKERLLRTHREIMMLNYFGNVVPDVVPVDDDKVDIEIAVEERASEIAKIIEITEVITFHLNYLVKMIGIIGLKMDILL